MVPTTWNPAPPQSSHADRGPVAKKARSLEQHGPRPPAPIARPRPRVTSPWVHPKGRPIWLGTFTDGRTTLPVSITPDSWRLTRGSRLPRQFGRGFDAPADQGKGGRDPWSAALSPPAVCVPLVCPSAIDRNRCCLGWQSTNGTPVDRSAPSGGRTESRSDGSAAAGTTDSLDEQVSRPRHPGKNPHFLSRLRSSAVGGVKWRRG